MSCSAPALEAVRPAGQAHRPARPQGAGWAATRQDREAVWARLAGAPFAPGALSRQDGHRLGLGLLTRPRLRRIRSLRSAHFSPCSWVTLLANTLPGINSDDAASNVVDSAFRGGA